MSVLLTYVSRSSDDNIIALTISCKNVWRLSIGDRSLTNRSVFQMGIPDVVFQRILLTKSGILEKLGIISYSIPLLELNLTSDFRFKFKLHVDSCTELA